MTQTAYARCFVGIPRAHIKKSNGNQRGRSGL